MNEIEDYVNALQEVIDSIPMEIQELLFIDDSIRIKNYGRIRIHYVKSNKAFGSNSSFFNIINDYLRRNHDTHVLNYFLHTHWFVASEKQLNKYYPHIDHWKENWRTLIKQYIIDQTLP